MKWPYVIVFVVLCFCKITLNKFHVLFLFLVSEYIDYYVIKHQTTWHEKYRVIVTYMHLFQNINNLLTIKYDIFWWRQKSLWNGGNKNLCSGLLDSYKPWNFEKCSRMEKQCDLNTYPTPNGFFIFTIVLIKFSDWSEQSSYYFKQYFNYYKYVI